MTDDIRFARRAVRHELASRDLVVASVRRVTDAIVRVTLTGDALEGFAADGPADHVKLVFGSAEAGTRVARDYTPLRFRPETPELDIDFVLHAHDGPAAAWARSAAPGDTLTVAGPRGSRLVPEGMDGLVLVVDESAFPAAERWLRLTPPAVPVTLLADAPDEGVAAYFADAATGREVDTRVVHEPEEVVAILDTVPAEGAFFFLAGEATRLIPLRRHLRRTRGLPREQVQASGYWKRGVAGLDHHAPVDPSDPD